MSGKLVAFFSASGVTAALAQRLSRAAGADLFEIKPAVPYTSADLDWTNASSRSSVEMKNPASRPEIAEKLPSMADYDVVFLGFPIWWYVAPRIIQTFLESYDFSGKTIALFATSGGSPMGRTLEILRPLCNASVKWLPAKMLNGATDSDLNAWLKSLKLD